MASYSGPHSKFTSMSCMDYATDFLPRNEYELVEENLKKFLDAPVDDFPNPENNYVKFT